MISAACGCVTLGAVPLAPASGSARRCLFVCEFDPTDRSSLVRPIRQQTIANSPHACMPKPFLGLLLILINHIKIPWARWLQGAVDARWVVVVVGIF